MHWEKDKKVWQEIKNMYESYVDNRRKARDLKQPYRQLFFSVIHTLKQRFLDAFGVGADQGPRAGPVVGVLRLPPSEDDPNSYYPIASKFYSQKGAGAKKLKLLSLVEIVEKIEKNKYEGKGAQPVQRFKKHVNSVLGLAINFHTARWTVEGKVEKCSKGARTVESMLKSLGIPAEFNAITAQRNVEGADAKAKLKVGTEVRLPAAKDVDAVKFLIEIQAFFAHPLMTGIEDELQTKLAIAQKDVEDQWVQCADCFKWRIVDAATYQEYEKDDAIFTCQKVKRSCKDACDSNMHADSVEVGTRRASSASLGVGPPSSDRSDGIRGGSGGGGGSGSSGSGGSKAKAKAIASGGGAVASVAVEVATASVHTVPRAGVPKGAKVGGKTKRKVVADTADKLQQEEAAATRNSRNRGLIKPPPFPCSSTGVSEKETQSVKIKTEPGLVPVPLLIGMDDFVPTAGSNASTAIVVGRKGNRAEEVAQKVRQEKEKDERTFFKANFKRQKVVDRGESAAGAAGAGAAGAAGGVPSLAHWGKRWDAGGAGGAVGKGKSASTTEPAKPAAAPPSSRNVTFLRPETDDDDSDDD